MDHNTNTIGDLIKAFLKGRGLDEKMDEVDINNNWEKIAGPMIANHTKKVTYHDHTLTIYLNSAALRHTLSFTKTEVIEKFNEVLGENFVRDIILK